MSTNRRDKSKEYGKSFTYFSELDIQTQRFILLPFRMGHLICEFLARYVSNTSYDYWLEYFSKKAVDATESMSDHEVKTMIKDIDKDRLAIHEKS